MRPLLLLPPRERHDIPHVVMPASKPDTLPLRKKTPFLDLPAELRNAIYELSECLCVYQCDLCLLTWRGGVSISDDSGRTEFHELHNYPSLHPQVTYESDDAYRPTALWVNRNSDLSIESEAAAHGKSAQALRTVSKSCQSYFNPTQLVTTGVFQPLLTRVCKQVHSDTLPIFYGTPLFYFTLFDEDIDRTSILSWLQTIGNGNAGLLRKLVILHREKTLGQGKKAKALKQEMCNLGVKGKFRKRACPFQRHLTGQWHSKLCPISYVLGM
jgi:hypothetical protein